MSRYTYPSFEDAYNAHCHAKSMDPLITILPEGNKAFWLGKKNAKKVLLYIHGGGFAFPGASLHLNFYESVINTPGVVGGDFAVCLVTYTLTPKALYPQQLVEGVGAMRHLLESYPPGNILLAGDSAGGNLAIAILSHIMHPHPSIKPLELTDSLGGLMLMSPWCSFRTAYNSYTLNADKDLMTANLLDRLSKLYVGPLQYDNPRPDYYIEAGRAPAEWWIGSRVRETLVLLGEDEILRDSVIEWAKTYQSVNNNAEIIIGRGEFHDHALYGPVLLDYNHTDTARALKKWIAEII